MRGLSQGSEHIVAGGIR